MQRARLSVFLFACCWGLQAQQAGTSSIWFISPADRQKLLAEQQKQMQLTEEKSAEIADQVQKAIQSQRQETLAAQQAALNALQAQQMSNAALQDALKAGFEAGAAKARVEAIGKTMESRGNLVMKSVQKWQPPRGFEAAETVKPTLSDPFASDRVSSPPPSSGESVKSAIEGTCLAFDPDRQLARATASCSWPGLNSSISNSDYPILSDGNVIDTSDRVKQFLEAARDSKQPIFVLHCDLHSEALVRLR